MERDGFVFYRSFYEGIKDLPRDIQGDVLTAIMEYGLNGATTDNLKPVARAIFTLIKPQIDANNKKFTNGKNGGRPPKEKPNQNQEETKIKPNHNQTITKAEPKEKVKDKDKEESKRESNTSPQGVQKNSDNLFSEINPEISLEEKSCAKKENNPKEEIFTKREFRIGLLELEANPNHIDDWFKVRDKRKAPYTRTAFDGLINECRKHNYPVSEAVKICAESNWLGFKYSWVQNLENNGKSNNQNSNNGFSYQNRNTATGFKASGKKSASSILAERARREAARNSNGGDFTTEAEVVIT